jgi:hypothetical protein
MKVKIPLIAEFDVPDGTANPQGEALLKLDAFRDGAAGDGILPSRLEG